jgi:hypothetical protein
VVYYSRVKSVKYPQRAVVFLVLESDAACTIFNGHSKKKVQFWFKYDATNTEVIENRIFEGTDCLKAALSSGMTSLQVMVASATSWSSGYIEAVSLLYLVPWPSTITYRVDTQDSKYNLIPLNTVSIDVADSSLLRLLFFRSLSIVSGCPVLNMCVCHHDVKFS